MKKRKMPILHYLQMVYIAYYKLTVFIINLKLICQSFFQQNITFNLFHPDLWIIKDKFPTINLKKIKMYKFLVGSNQDSTYHWYIYNSSQNL